MTPPLQVRFGPGPPAPPLGADGEAYFDTRAGAIYTRGAAAWSPLRGDGGGLKLAADATTSNLVTLQAAVDSAIAAAKTGNRAARVYVPGAADGYALDGPIYVDGAGVTIEGDGATTRFGAAPNYGGHLFAFGVDRLASPATYRTPADWLDATAGARRALDTAGRVYFAVSGGHALQIGGTDPATNFPDNWQSAAGYTWEFTVRLASGTTPTNQSVFLGLCDPDNNPAPWCFGAGSAPNTVAVSLTKRGESTPRNVTVAVPAAGPYGLAFQYDPATGSVLAWCNGTAAACSPANIGPGVLAAPDGLTALRIGSAVGTLPPSKNNVLAMALGGLRVSRGPVYTTAATQTRADGGPVNDRSRYFTETPATVGLLPLDDAPATHFRARGNGVTGVGFAFDADRPGGQSTVEAVLSRVRLTGGQQAPLAFSRLIKFEATDLRIADANQAIASVENTGAWTLSLTNVGLDAWDAPVAIEYAIVNATNLYVNTPGVDAFRVRGGSTSWANVFVGAPNARNKSVFRFLSGNSGGCHEVRRLNLDNEGDGPADAVIVAGQNKTGCTLLRLDNLVASKVGGTYLRLNPAPAGGVYQPAKVDATNLMSFDGNCGTLVNVTGPGWFGTVDGGGLASASAAGSGADTAALAVTPPGR